MMVPARSLAIAMAACCGTPLLAQFADPVLLKAGDALLGNKRLYPSPVAHDLTGDGRADIVVGDLRGHLTYAPRLDGDAVAFGAEVKLKDAEGKILDFGNW